MSIYNNIGLLFSGKLCVRQILQITGCEFSSPHHLNRGTRGIRGISHLPGINFVASIPTPFVTPFINFIFLSNCFQWVNQFIKAVCGTVKPFDSHVAWPSDKFCHAPIRPYFYQRRRRNRKYGE